MINVVLCSPNHLTWGCAYVKVVFTIRRMVTGHNGHKPKTATTETATNRNGHKPERPQTETATNRNGHKSERPQAETVTDRKGHKPKRPQTGLATDRNGHKPKRSQTGTATSRNVGARHQPIIWNKYCLVYWRIYLYYIFGSSLLHHLSQRITSRHSKYHSTSSHIASQCTRQIQPYLLHRI